MPISTELLSVGGGCDKLTMPVTPTTQEPQQLASSAGAEVRELEEFRRPEAGGWEVAVSW
jgi:hypothetical protein